MYYLIILLIIFFLGFVTLKAWLGRSRPSKQSIEKHQKRSQEQIALGQWEAAWRTLKPLYMNSLGGIQTLVLYCSILRGMKRFQEALIFIDKALKSYPSDLSLLLQRGKTLLDQGDAPAAISALQQCEPILRTEEDILDLASALFQTGKIQEAWLYVADFLLESQNGRLLALAGDCQFHQKNYEQALVYYYKALQFHWSNHQILSKIGYCLSITDRLQEAQKYYEAILAQDTSDVVATIGLASCLEEQQQYERALIVYQGGKAWNLGDVRILKNAGICAAKLHLNEFAELYLREALKRGTGNPELFSYLGYSLEQQKRWEEAESIYLQLIQDYPDEIAGYRALSWLFGVGLTKTLSNENGLLMAQKALELHPDHTSWEILSACEARTGNFIRAHEIQEQLSLQADDKRTRLRRQHAMRTLRKKIPLNENLVSRVLVA